ncbi:MAG: molybdopterin-dependent oxidoreductase [Nitrososphaerota archaeon]|nr:molybdopterin-dependent oxidoreductase [Nitrososphaerota archaeon]
MTQVLETRESKTEGWIRSHPRIDGKERVTGRARYAGDWKVPEMLYGRMMTSRIPHGNVKRIDISKAAAIDGVKAIITCFDDKTIWHSGEREHERRLFTDRVRFVGDCIGAVATTDRKIAQRALDSIEVEYEDLPTIFTIQDALREGAVKIWETGNVIGPHHTGFGDIDKALHTGNIITVERDYETSRVSNAPMERACSLAWWDGGKLTVVAGTQGVFGCREALANDLGIPKEDIRVITKYKGGGFGGKISATNYDLAAVLLSKKTGKPVLVEYDRSEDFVATHPRWPSVQHLKGFVSKTGKLIGVDLKALCDVGAYSRSLKMGTFISGAEVCYDYEAWRGDISGVYTNTPGTGAMRAPPGPQSYFSAETLIDEIAYELKINPLEFRLRNLVVMPHREAHLTSNGLRECLMRGSEAIDWKNRWKPPPRDLGDSGCRGIGVAVVSWHARVGKGEAKIRIRSDGIVEVHVGVVDIGTGAKTTMAMIASKVLRVPLESMEVIWGDTEAAPYARGEAGSTTTALTGTAVREAAAMARSKLLELASTQLKTTAHRLEMESGYIAAGAQRIKIGEVLLRAGIQAIEESASTEPKLPEHADRLAFGAHFAEVEVDVDTGRIDVTEYVAAHDSGEIVNQLTAANQVKGGVVMGLGMALSERQLLDKNYGSVLNPSFMSYRVPNVTTTCRIKPIFVETDDQFGPKGLAEVPTVPVPAVIGNAIFNATGVRLRKLPFTPESFLRETKSY